MSDATELHHALAPAYARLEQVRAIWVDASKKYFEPASFQIALQHLITTSRTVSFVLQKQKANIPNFDDWYERKQLDWRADDVMRWAVNARNTIEKIGDLETYSEVRATLIAGHVLGPESIWVPEQKFGLPIDFLKSIPTKYLSAHVVAHGHLILERRWVANTLPAHGLLEAMSHVMQNSLRR
ncbi:MAG: hypothetical protein GYB36_07845 [Alphaproteobacteria bacterium]|nr:hypothetical protein [Alphaproteobacteria bacterium]